MSIIISTIQKCCVKSLEEKLLALSLTSTTQIREKHKLNPPPRLRNPTWFTKQNRVVKEEFLTHENKEFLREIVQDKVVESESKLPVVSPKEWNDKLQRTGVIARKVGIYPMWLKDGTRIQTTLLQVLDNHVIRYYTPEEYDPPRKQVGGIKNKKGCLLLGAESADPSEFTKEYCGLFRESGVIPKRVLSRFFVSPDAVLPLGTQVNVLHFQVGNVVDVRGKTVDRGFQGVMKRHGFKGMPASHGVTKTHRKGGCIGGGGEKGRVWPGTKMPGHMGNRHRIQKGLKILRINTKYNIMWVSGQAIAGETNSIVTIYDTKLPLRKPTNPVPFPTYIGEIDSTIPEDIYDEQVHMFNDPTISYDEK
ncbi:unnamed protein product [Brassicogethes aeneus]|uniref:Large ribosomal subunit protein uL3m n=1 Tax=Brassicogethes aeneus TaxID=1431903 RepID=A0A9P0FIC8_BRAAE|nr:unnamed protein product [Brassicogethes aeneus]